MWIDQVVPKVMKAENWELFNETCRLLLYYHQYRKGHDTFQYKADRSESFTPLKLLGSM